MTTAQKPKVEEPEPKPRSGHAAAVPQSEEGRSLTLYELTGTYAELATALNSAGDEETPVLDALLETFRSEIKERVDYLGMVMAQKKAEVDWIADQSRKFSDEAKRLMDRAGTRERGIERLRDFIKSCLAEFGPDKQKVEGPTFTTTLSKEGDASVEIDDETKVPDEFKVATIKMPLSLVDPEILTYVSGTRVDKKKIDSTLKETGVIPPGCKVGPRKRNLRIY